MLSIIETINTAKQIEALKQKLKEKKGDVNNTDLQLLREFCCHENPNITNYACNEVISFVKYNNFPLMQAITWFLSSLQAAKNIDGIARAVKDLLLLHIRSSKSNQYVNPFNLHSSQHPFIFILKQDSINWQIVSFLVSSLFKDGDTRAICVSLKPVFKYVLWSPPGIVDSGCKRDFWKFLIKYFPFENGEFFFETVCWLRIDDQRSILDVNSFLEDFYNSEYEKFIGSVHSSRFLCILSAEVSCQLARMGYEPQLCLQYMKEYSKKYPEITDLILILFADTLPHSSLNFLTIFLQTIVDLINSNGVVHDIVIWTVISSVLPWIIHPACDLEEINEPVNSIFEMVEGKAPVRYRKSCVDLLDTDKFILQYIESSQSAYYAFLLLRIMDTAFLPRLLDNLLDFVITSDIIENNSLVNLFVSGIFLGSRDPDMQIKAINILMKTNAGFQLPLLLYSLSKTTCPNLLLKVFHSLPLTAVVKENISPILGIIRTLADSGQSVLVNLSICLHLILWKVEDRCYQFLYDQLMNYHTSTLPKNRQMDQIVASAIRDICTLKPELKGKEWVGILSDIMTRYVDQEISLPLVWTLDAILKLCQANVVDVFTVYEELSKHRLFTDKRSEVIEKLCKLIAVMFQEATDPAYVERKYLVDEALSHIWKFIHFSSDKKVKQEALNALAKYNFEEMPPRIIPQELFKYIEIAQPKVRKGISHNNTESLLFIPGSFWLDYLQNAGIDEKNDICDLLTSWLIDEVKKFNRSFFHSIRGERDSVAPLHNQSIFKAIITYTKKMANRIKINSQELTPDEILMITFCLKILNGQKMKSLPPFNWYFLEEFYKCHDEKVKEQLITFFAKESITSASAKTCLENFLKSFDVTKHDVYEIEIIFRIVAELANGVSSEVVSSFLSSTMQNILDRTADDHEGNAYRSICLCLQKTFENSTIEEHNCEAICKSIRNWWENVDVENESFEYLVQVASEMPVSYVEYLSSDNALETLSIPDLYKILKLRCTVALKDESNPFIWLNQCLEATIKQLEGKVLYFERSLAVIVKYRLHPSRWSWLSQLQDRLLATKDEDSEGVNEFLCDVYAFSVVNFSFFYSFLNDATLVEECREHFPQALRNILVDEVSGQVIEWLSHVCQTKKVNRMYARLFWNAIIALKDNKHLQKSIVWCRIQNS